MQGHFEIVSLTGTFSVAGGHPMCSLHDSTLSPWLQSCEAALPATFIPCWAPPCQAAQQSAGLAGFHPLLVSPTQADRQQLIDTWRMHMCRAPRSHLC